MAKSTFDDLYISDDKKATEGVEFEIGTNIKGDPIFFTIAENGNPKHEKAQRKRSRMLERTRGSSTSAINRRDKIIAEVVAEGLLLSWRGVLDEEGNEVPSTFENKVEALLKYRKLQNEILELSDEPIYYKEDEEDQEEAKEETEKNSEMS